MFSGKKEDIKVIEIRHGEKMYETLLTSEECAKAIDIENYYRVPADNRGLNYDKYFKKATKKGMYTNIVNRMVWRKEQYGNYQTIDIDLFES